MSFFESIFYMAWRGIAIGIIMSAPMGPVGMLCIQRTLDKGRRAGLYTGIGAAISDLFYALLTGFGLSFIEEFLERNSNVIQLAGSAVLIAFGIYLFKKNPSKALKKPAEDEISVKKNIFGGFIFTFSNPLILFLIVGLFARFNFLLPEFKIHQYLTGFVFIFIGALMWWWLITFSVDKVRSHFNIRSMWLINKIIGSIILLFAVVGIVTATTALANGAETECWNTRRGFGGFSDNWPAATEEGHITNNSSDTVYLLTPARGSDAVEFRFKIRNHRANPSKKYSFTDAAGEKHSVALPRWGIILKGTNGDVVKMDLHPTEGNFDGVSTSATLETSITVNGQTVDSNDFSDDSNLLKKAKNGIAGPDPTGAFNFFKISAFNDLITLFGGLHSPQRLLQAELPRDFMADSIGFYLCPGASVELSEMRLTTGRYLTGKMIWDDPDLLDEYLSGSRDLMEGYWQILDRSLEESLLRLGGDYRMAIVRGGDGYDIIYLSGATVNGDRWVRGMQKGHLSPSGIEGVWNVEWTDAMFQPLSHELKAQKDDDGALTIQFPYQNSRLRLISIPGEASGR